MTQMLSIIIPVYNEVQTIGKILDRIERVSFPLSYEVIVVDDGSTDGTREFLKNIMHPNCRVFFHESNIGKGSALRTGFAQANGDLFVVQDADLEYHPRDILTLLDTCLKKGQSVVYGSRVLASGTKDYSTLLFHFGGILVTWWTNVLYGAHITDEATGYKLFTREVLDRIQLRCRRFEFCPEFTGKALRAGFTIQEVPIAYTPRGHEEGKKIKISDGLEALWVLFRVRFFGK